MGWFSKAKVIIQKAVPEFVRPAWLVNTPQWTDFNQEAAIREGYKASAWVYACVKKRADAVASVPLVVEVKTADGWQAAPAHPLQRLLDEPNPDMDIGEVMRLMVTHLDLCGNAYLLKTRASGPPLELWPMLPTEVAPIPGTERLVDYYQHKNRPAERIAAQDVFHATYCNPESLYLGMSPLQAAGRGVDVDNAAAAWQKISMTNRGVPDGIFNFDDELTEEQYEAAKAAVASQYSEGRKNWVLSRVKYQQMSLTPIEMDFIATRQNAMQQICAVYGTPSEMISGMGDANRASSDTVRRTFWIDTITPLLQELQSTLNLSLAREFGRAGQLRIRFDTSAVPALQEDYSAKVANAKALWSMGVPFDVISDKLDLGIEEIEGGDMGYLPSGVIPANFDLPDPTDDPATAGAAAYGTDTDRA